MIAKMPARYADTLLPCHAILIFVILTSRRIHNYKDLTGFECHLQHGDTLFIPSRWWHYVEYTTDGLSLSLRAMPNSWWARFTGLVSIFKLKVIDARMGNGSALRNGMTSKKNGRRLEFAKNGGF